MTRPRSNHPTELELAILKILWQDSPRSVQDVRDQLASGPNRRDLTHSSVITMLNIMVRKKYLKRNKRSRAYFFEPIVRERDVNRGMLGDLVDRVYDGSVKAAVLELLEAADIDSKDIAEIRQMISRKAKNRK